MGHRAMVLAVVKLYIYTIKLLNIVIYICYIFVDNRYNQIFLAPPGKKILPTCLHMLQSNDTATSL